MSFTKLFLMGLAGSVYETLTGQNHTQRTIKRKVSNAVGLLTLKTPKRSWEDGRANAQYRAVTPTDDECERLNREAARSV